MQVISGKYSVFGFKRRHLNKALVKCAKNSNENFLIGSTEQ